jgi:hypothetical protein
LSERSQIAGNVQLASLKDRLEPGDELPAKYTPEYVDEEKESRTRPNPACVIEGEPAIVGELQASSIQVAPAHRVLIAQAATIAADIAEARETVKAQGAYVSNEKTGAMQAHPARSGVTTLT